MLVYLTVSILGIFVFLFLFWSKLKEDYIGNQIFTTSIYIIFFILISLILSNYFLIGFWFWFACLGVMFGYLLGLRKFHLHFYETFDALVIAFLPLVGLIFLTNSVINSVWQPLIMSAVIIFLIVLYGYLNAKYKTFTWYRSGRVGFAGLLTGGLFFLMRGIIAIILGDMISFVGRWEPLISGITAFVIFLLLFDLSRKT